MSPLSHIHGKRANGLDMENYSDEDESNWLYASDTDVPASASLKVNATTHSKTLVLTGSSTNYLFTSVAGGGAIDVDEFSIGSSTSDCATNIATIINESASADFSANAVGTIVYITSSVAGTSGNSNSLSGAAGYWLVTGSDGVANSGLSASFAGGSAYTSWTTQGGDYFTDASSSFTASFDDGFEDMELDITPLVEQWINSPGNTLGTKSNYGVGVRLASSIEDATTSYYTKRFFARGSQFYFKRPVIEARWDSSKKDDRGNFYLSSSLVPAADNLMKLYLYNGC